MAEKELSDPERAWRQVDEELTARAAKHQAPGDWHALGRALQVERNTANNWRTRKRLPQPVWQSVADLFGWSLPRLLGQEIAPDRSTRSPEERDAPLIQETSPRLSREEFLRICANLTDDQTQLLARLMAALGWVPGVTVEVIPKWIVDLDKNTPTRPPKLMTQEPAQRRGDEAEGLR